MHAPKRAGQTTYIAGHRLTVMPSPKLEASFGGVNSQRFDSRRCYLEKRLHRRFVPARLLAALTWTALITACSEEVRVGSWSEVTPLPMPVANNATASLLLPMGPVLFSFLGLDTTKAFSGITQRAFAYEVDADRWRELSPVPGPEGRLAATAVGFGGRILLFGGYTVDAEGGEVSAPDLDIFDPQTDAWLEGEPFPLPVDDAVSGVWRDSLVFVVSGWSQRDNVDAVQIYDPADDRWGAATPIPGPPVFGHAGAGETSTRPTRPGSIGASSHVTRVPPGTVWLPPRFRTPASLSSQAEPTTRTTMTGSATTAFRRNPPPSPLLTMLRTTAGSSLRTR